MTKITLSLVIEKHSKDDYSAGFEEIEDSLIVYGYGESVSIAIVSLALHAREIYLNLASTPSEELGQHLLRELEFLRNMFEVKPGKTETGK